MDVELDIEGYSTNFLYCGLENVNHGLAMYDCHGQYVLTDFFH